MRSNFVWLLLLPAMAWALWELAVPEPLISPLSAGLLLLILGGLAGLRISADSIGRFVRDLTVLNKYLGEQNRDLAEMNHVLLKQNLIKQDEPQRSETLEAAEERK